MIRKISSAIVVLAAGFWGQGAVRADDKPASPPPLVKASGKQSVTAKSIGQPLPELNFSGAALSDCIAFLADATNMNISVDWKALDAAKVEKDTPITLRLTPNISVRKALKLILQQAGGVGTLEFYVEEGVLQITTQEEADKQMITRTYPISDLLFQAPDYNDAPTVDISQSNNASASGSGGGGGGGGSTQTFQSTGSNTSVNTGTARADRAADIIKLITSTVRPEVWRDNGGTATITFFRDSLIVTAPRSVHAMLSAQYR